MSTGSANRSDNGIRCGCNKFPRVYTSRTGANPGRVFFRCVNSFNDLDCGYFVWEDELTGGSASRATVLTFRRMEDLEERIEATIRRMEDVERRLEAHVECRENAGSILHCS